MSAADAQSQEHSIIIGTELSYPPYSFLDENGQAAGFNVDLTRAIAEAMDMDVEIRIGPWGDIRQALEAGEIDAIAGMYYSDARDRLVDFSPPYTVVHHAIFVRDDAPAIETEEDLLGKNIIVMRGDIMHDYVLKKELSENPVLTNTQAEALKLLASGKGDCALIARLPGIHWTKELGLDNVVTTGPLLRPSDYSFAVTEGNTELLARLTEGLATIKEANRYKAIRDEWLGVLEPGGLSWKVVLKYSTIVIVPLLLIMAVFVCWSRMLSHRVKQRTRELHESENRYRVIAEDMPVLICRFLPGGEITYVNNAYCRYFDKTSEALVGSSFLSLIPGEDREMIMAGISALTVESPLQSHEHKVLALDGETHWQRWTNRALFDDRGEIVAYQSIGEDITERKQTEEAVAERMKELNCLHQVSRLLETPGVSPEDIFQGTVDLIPQAWHYPQLTCACITLLGREYKTGGFRETEWMQHADIVVRGENLGRVQVCLLEMPVDEEAPFLPEEQQLVETLAERISHITDRLQSEKELQSAKEYTDSIIRSMADMLIVVSPEGAILTVNEATCLQLDFDEDDLIGKPATLLFEEEEEEEETQNILSQHALPVKRTILRRLVREGSVNNIEKKLRAKDGTSVPVLLSGAVLRNNEQEIKGIVCLGIDITERKKAEEELRKSESRLVEAQRLAGMGDFNWEVETGKATWSEGMYDLLGYDKSEEIDYTKVNAAIHHPDDLDRITDWLNKCLESGKSHPPPNEYRLIRKDGKVINVRTSVSVKYKGGKPLEMMGTCIDITDIRRLEIEKRQSEDTYHNLLTSLNAGVVVHAPDTSILIANHAASKILGLSEDQLYGKQAMDPHWKFMRENGSDMPLDEYPVNRVLSTNEPLHNQVVGVNRPRMGDVAWVLVNGFPAYQESGQLEQIVINFVDITERKLAEEENRRFKTISDTAVYGKVVADLQGNLLYINRFFAEIHGYSPEELIGKPLSLFHSPEQMEAVNRLNASIVQEGAFAPATVWHRHKDGTEFPMLMSGVLIKGDGNPQCIAASGIDITAQHQAQAKLAESEAKHMSMVANISDVIGIIGVDGFMIYKSPNIEKWFGWKPQDLIGTDGWLTVHPDDLERIQKEFYTVLEKDKSVTTVEYRYKCKDGHYTWIELTATNLINAPLIGGLLLNYHDITERKQAEIEKEKLENQLRQAQKMEAVGRLAGGVAHDFNNMLGVILGHADMLLEQIDTDQPFHTDLTEIRNAGMRSADLTRQLLAFARKQTVAPKVIDLNKTVTGMTTMLKRLIGENIDLAWIPDDKLWSVKIDPSQIDQILANLCVNARDAIADVGKVTIETSNTALDTAYCETHTGFMPGEYVLLAVSDNGCGMDSETLDNAFEPFFTTKKSNKGTGLGLATVYGVVKQNQGFINIYSEPSQGTTIKIYLPRHFAKTAETEERKPQAAARGSETILLVEDEPAILRMTTMMLEREGYTVVAAGTPGEAIELAHIHSGEIHLLMTDVVMPEMNGRDLVRNILSHYPNLKRLFMSGYTANVIAHHGVLDEGVNFIQKPFSKGDLAAKVREALERE